MDEIQKQHYESLAVQRAVNAIIDARDVLGITSKDVLSLVAQRFGEKLAVRDMDAELREAMEEMGIDIRPVAHYSEDN